MTILGIDPGTTRIGVGVIKKEGGRLIHEKSGLLRLPGEGGAAAQLVAIRRALETLLEETRPERVGVEKLFFSKNKKTALAVSQARGVIIQTVAARGIPLVELSPAEAKMAVTGSGNADKKTVARMVGMLLKTSFSGAIDDATDALAIAIAASQTRPGEEG